MPSFRVFCNAYGQLDPLPAPTNEFQVFNHKNEEASILNTATVGGQIFVRIRKPYVGTYYTIKY